LTVECGRCRRETTIANFTGTLESGDLLLVGKCGKCGECRGDVVRQQPAPA
jgi:hypothetical protein